MNDLLIIATILFAWVALNRWILPAMGIETCMSGGCCGGSCRTNLERPESNEQQAEMVTVDVANNAADREAGQVK